MTWLTTARLRLLTTGLLFLLGSACPLAPQGVDGTMQMGTRERLDVEPWWPTKSTVAESEFVGSAACMRCHTDQAPKQSSSMARAAEPASSATFLTFGSATGSLRPFTYTVKAAASGLEYSVSDGAHKLSHPLAWVMGAGDLGRTFLYQSDGHWYQSEVTLYTKAASLDITTGLPPASGSALSAALGQSLSTEDARTCFGCHTVHATTTSGFNPLHAEAGLGCEACHGPGRAHAEAESTKAPNGSPAAVRAIFNPAKLSPVDSIDYCGACHRTFVDATLSTAHGTSTAVVRFQPYRLEESKCWRATQDARLTCVACHDPHQQVSRDSASYDKHCLQCHSVNADNAATPQHVKACPQAKTQCTQCHMPKVEIPSMHGSFTDHYIRIARTGESFPP